MKSLLALSVLCLGLPFSAIAQKEDLEQLATKLKAAVASGKMSEEEASKVYVEAMEKLEQKINEKEADGAKGKKADDNMLLIWELFQAVEKGELTAEEAMIKYKGALQKGSGKKGKKPSSKTATPKKLSGLPKTSTAGEEEGPSSTFIFGWAANATHRFMDNSHAGEAQKLTGLSFRLDHRNHDAIGRTWENVTINIAHGDWSSLNYNRSKNYKLADKPTKVFSKKWSFPTLRGFPPLEPASWGGPQNSLSFRFDEPFAYNGKDAIYVEFIFSGGKAEDDREWKGELPFGFEYYLDSMPEVGGWREIADNARKGGVYTAEARVAAATSYTAGGQSVWTSSEKGLPFLKWDMEK